MAWTILLDVKNFSKEVEMNPYWLINGFNPLIRTNCPWILKLSRSQSLASPRLSHLAKGGILHERSKRNVITLD
jgi:hypothetical protein